MLRPGAAGCLAAMALTSTLAMAQPAPVPAPLPTLGGDSLLNRGTDRWYFQTSAYTQHWDPKPHHNNTQRLLNVERQGEDRWIWGGAFFYNSFDQPCQYLYAGYLWRPASRWRGAYVKLTGGLLHGYKGEYQNNIPLNNLGVAPALLPAVGLSGKRFATEVVVFGTSGVMWNVGFFFD
ncbi:MAG: sn-glycerol-3-phosphate transporter [Burkholderiales bacterium]|nr:sn-glycerol-3-phosphate transporter [Burkholderiales bacterium]